MDSEPTIRLTCTTPIPVPDPDDPKRDNMTSSATYQQLPPSLPRVPSGMSLVLPTHHLASHAASGSSYASHAAALGIHRTPSPALLSSHYMSTSPTGSNSHLCHAHYYSSPLSASASVVDTPGIDEEDGPDAWKHPSTENHHSINLATPTPTLLHLSNLNLNPSNPNSNPNPNPNPNHRARYASAPPRPISTTCASPALPPHAPHPLTGHSSTASLATPTTAIPAPTSSAHLIIFMVGLPARGKSYISQKLVRYLTWLGYHTKVFNVGNRRRTVATASSSADAPKVAGQGATSTFFDPTNTSAATLRDQLALDTLDELIDWLHTGNGTTQAGSNVLPSATGAAANGASSPRIAIHDATNTTRARRHLLISRLKSRLAAHPPAGAATPRVKFLFLESVCTDPAVIEANVRMKLQSPDYRNTPADVALADFTQRMRNYERAYQPLGVYEDEHRWPYVKLVDVGRKVEVSGLRGYLMSQVVFYLMNINIRHRTIWLTRHGESTSNIQGRIGGDAPLTDRGQRYAHALARFFAKVYGQGAACAPRLDAASPARKQSVGAEAVAPRRAGGSASRFGTAVGAVTPVPRSDAASPHGSQGDVGTEAAAIAEAVERAARGGSSKNEMECSADEEDEEEDEYESSDDDYQVDDVTPPASPSPTTLLPPAALDHAAQLPAGRHGRRALHRIPIWSSTLRRATATAAPIQAALPTRMPLRTLRVLNEIHSGAFENLTPLEIEAGFPGEVARRQADKLTYRYPGLGGESYLDVIARLKPMIVETERITRDVCIVTHNVVARIMMAYWLGVPWEDMPRLEVPLGELYAMQPRPYGTEVVRFRWDEQRDEIVRVDDEEAAGVERGEARGRNVRVE